jgi:hypothetical protein
MSGETTSASTPRRRGDSPATTSNPRYFAAYVDKGVFTISPFETVDADTLSLVPREGALSSTALTRRRPRTSARGMPRSTASHNVS